MNDTDKMDYSEFVDVATDLYKAILGRIPERWREGFANDVADGFQWPDIAMRNLVLLLEREQIPVTPAERDTVVRLMSFCRIEVARAEAFNVTGGEE